MNARETSDSATGADEIAALLAGLSPDARDVVRRVLVLEQPFLAQKNPNRTHLVREVVRIVKDVVE